ncbi:hypothetical protein GLW07_03485 [Bacillus hwajinpoensis]|uniref:Uncharacterized protein n=1 Tax=Guptibacillus hwajinpoensis TaxID=208199 RepID=A0A845ERI7_9BACL|nr:hypothetical protein [Pseudalkalibacillus hwajinpoensis]MYL62414.1 hypothetical protein [Pseudalkalibacillus hwajinpoensis]
MKKTLYSPIMISFILGLLASLIYSIILAAGGYHHTGLAGFFSILTILVAYLLLSTYWLPTLLEIKTTIALGAGITFHVISSFTLVVMMAGTLPEISELLLPYLSTLLISFLIMIVILIAGIILGKVDFTKFTNRDKKMSMKG